LVSCGTNRVRVPREGTSSARKRSCGRARIVVIGTSSGGVEALARIAGGLPPDLPAAVFVVLHFPEGAPSVLPRTPETAIEKIAPMLACLSREPAEEERSLPRARRPGARVEDSRARPDRPGKRPGELSHFTCPGCAGPLYEMQQDDLIRCRVGHAYTAESMLDERSEELEQALYVALNTLEENALMADRLANRSGTRWRASRSGRRRPGSRRRSFAASSRRIRRGRLSRDARPAQARMPCSASARSTNLSQFSAIHSAIASSSARFSRATAAVSSSPARSARRSSTS
jgi:CheB methylesterase